MALEKRDLPPESGNVDAYVCDILICITLCDIAINVLQQCFISILDDEGYKGQMFRDNG